MISGVTSPLAGNRGPCNWMIWSEFSEGIVCKSWVDERNPRGSKHKHVETGGSISKSCDLLTHVPWQPHGVEVGEQIHWLLSFLLPTPDGASRCAEHSRNPDREDKGRVDIGGHREGTHHRRTSIISYNTSLVSFTWISKMWITFWSFTLRDWEQLLSHSPLTFEHIAQTRAIISSLPKFYLLQVYKLIELVRATSSFCTWGNQGPLKVT